MSEVQRLQNVVQVKDACIKNYTNFIKQLQATKAHTHTNIERHVYLGGCNYSVMHALTHALDSHTKHSQ